MLEVTIFYAYLSKVLRRISIKHTAKMNRSRELQLEVTINLISKFIEG